MRFSSDAAPGTIMRAFRSMGVYPFLGVLSFVAFIIHLWASHGGSSATQQAVHQIIREGGKQQTVKDKSGVPQPLGFEEQVRNETLGFQEVFVISLPERTDRLDAFTLISSLTGFRAALAPGIHGDTVPDKSLPSTLGLHKDEGQRNAVVGTWRAHVNIAQDIVRRRLGSALIIEDDSDWDLSLKDRLVDFAHGSRHFSTQAAGGAVPKNPYGDNWDLLWLGHCSITECFSPDPHTANEPSNPHPEGTKISPQQRFIIENDATVPPWSRRLNFATIPNISEYKNTTRAVFRADYGICLYGYALSFAGAQKVLRAQALRNKWAPIDIGIAEMCQDVKNPFDCIGVFPQLFDSHKMAGAMDRDSNIDQYPSDEVRERAYTANIVYSMRDNVDRILRGQKPMIQWPEEAVPEAEPGGVRYRIVDLEPGKSPNIMPENAVFKDSNEDIPH